MFNKQLNIWNYGKKELIVASDLHISIVRALLDLQANIGINDHLVIANGLQKDYLQKMQQRTGRTNRALIRLWSSHVRAYMATHSNPQSWLLHLFMTCFSPQIHSPEIPTHLRRSQSSCSLSVSHYTHTTVTKMLWGAFPTHHDMHTNQWKLLHITSHWQEINSKHTLIPCTFPLPTSWAGCNECLCCWFHQRHPPTAQQWINGVHPHLFSEAWHKTLFKEK
jgi:hypothetical protein